MHGYLMTKLPELMDVWTVTLTHKDIVKHGVQSYGLPECFLFYV
jgi:hypothetical protein